MKHEQVQASGVFVLATSWYLNRAGQPKPRINYTLQKNWRAGWGTFYTAENSENPQLVLHNPQWQTHLPSDVWTEDTKD